MTTLLRIISRAALLAFIPVLALSAIESGSDLELVRGKASIRWHRDDAPRPLTLNKSVTVLEGTTIDYLEACVIRTRLGKAPWMEEQVAAPRTDVIPRSNRNAVSSADDGLKKITLGRAGTARAGDNTLFVPMDGAMIIERFPVFRWPPTPAGKQVRLEARVEGQRIWQQVVDGTAGKYPPPPDLFAALRKAAASGASEFSFSSCEPAEDRPETENIVRLLPSDKAAALSRHLAELPTVPGTGGSLLRAGTYLHFNLADLALAELELALEAAPDDADGPLLEFAALLWAKAGNTRRASELEKKRPLSLSPSAAPTNP